MSKTRRNKRTKWCERTLTDGRDDRPTLSFSSPRTQLNERGQARYGRSLPRPRLHCAAQGGYLPLHMPGRSAADHQHLLMLASLSTTATQPWKPRYLSALSHRDKHTGSGIPAAAAPEGLEKGDRGVAARCQASSSHAPPAAKLNGMRQRGMLGT